MDTLRWFFARPDGGLRAGWRVAAHLPLLVAALVVAVVVGIAIGAGAQALLGDDLSPRATTVVYGTTMTALTAALLAVHAVSGWVLDARWTPVGVTWGRVRGGGLGGPLGRTAAEVAGGVAIGTVALLPGLAILAATGLDVVPAEWTVDHLVGFALDTLVLIPAAGVEEVLFRGYAFVWTGRAFAALALFALARVLPDRAPELADLLGFGALLVGTSALFGIGHAANPGVTVLSTLNTTLAGLWLGVIVLRTRSLWVAWGAHWAWNWVHGIVIGLPLSGVQEGNSPLEIAPLFRATPTATADWLSGGDYGLEGSIAATVAMVIAIAVAAVLPRRAAADGMSALARPFLDDASMAQQDAATE